MYKITWVQKVLLNFIAFLLYLIVLILYIIYLGYGYWFYIDTAYKYQGDSA